MNLSPAPWFDIFNCLMFRYFQLGDYSSWYQDEGEYAGGYGVHTPAMHYD